MFESLLERGGLSLDRLRNFLAVADAGTISKAAPGDLNRQSLISRQIRELEEFFGAELTAKRGKSIAITEAGLRLAGVVRTSLRGLEDFLDDARGEHKTFTIGAGDSVVEWLLCPAGAGIREALGGATLRLEGHRTLDLVERVRNGRLDFAVIRADALPEGAPSLPLAEVKFALCVPDGLLGKPPRLPSDLAELPLALPVPGGSFHKTLQGYFESAGIPWRPAVETVSFTQAFALVEGGEFAAVLPDMGAAKLPEKGVIVKPVPALKPHTRKLVLHWNKRQMATRGVSEAAVKKLRDAIRSAKP